MIFKAIARIYKIRYSKKCRYKGAIESTNIVEEIQVCEKNWKEYVEGMQDVELLKLPLKYQPVGKMK